MMIYITILIVLFLFWIINIKKNRLQEKTLAAESTINNVTEQNSSIKIVHTYSDMGYAVVVVISLIAFLGLRGITGTDTVTYLGFYETNNYPINMEKVYLYISRYFAEKNFSFNTLQVCIAAGTIIPVFIEYWKKSANIYFTSFLFYLFPFYLYAFNVSRQTLAAAFVVCAYLVVKNLKLRNLIISIILIAFAVGIHKTSLYIAVILFITEFIFNKLLNKKKIILLVGIVMGILSLILYRSDFVYNYLMAQSSRFDEYSSYITSTTATASLTNKSVLILIVTLISCVIICLYAFYPKEERDSQLFSAFLIFTMFEMLQVNWISDRMVVFVLPILPLFFTYTVYTNGMKDKKNRALRYSICILGVLMGLIMFGRVVGQNFGEIIPYIGVKNVF